VRHDAWRRALSLPICWAMPSMPGRIISCDFCETPAPRSADLKAVRSASHWTWSLPSGSSHAAGGAGGGPGAAGVWAAGAPPPGRRH
jgi:hypothetical protein